MLGLYRYIIRTTHEVIDDRIYGTVEVTKPVSYQSKVDSFTSQLLQHSGISGKYKTDNCTYDIMLSGVSLPTTSLPVLSFFLFFLSFFLFFSLLPLFCLSPIFRKVHPDRYLFGKGTVLDTVQMCLMPAHVTVHALKVLAGILNETNPAMNPIIIRASACLESLWH